MDAKNMLLEVNGISHRFGGLHVLQGVELGVARNSITGLIGPNGAGKSTLFNIISGFLAPDEGRVVYQGADITGTSSQHRSHAGLMRTFQTPKIFHNMTVRENLVAGCYNQTRSGVLADLLGTPGSRRDIALMRRAAIDAMEKFGLTGVRDQLAGELPGGLQRLVELVRASVNKPEMLCLDEPSSGLNTEEVGQLKETLARLNQEGITILLVSHDMDLVKIAPFIHVLNFGKIIARGSLAEIQADAGVREAYLGI